MAQDTIIDMMGPWPRHPDHTETVLSRDEEAAFDQWVKTHKAAKDEEDNPKYPWAQHIDHPHNFYDYKGFWRERGSGKLMKPGEHFPDRYKQPGHLTFSNESKYATPENPGGSWEPNTDIYITADGDRINMGYNLSDEDQDKKDAFIETWEESLFMGPQEPSDGRPD